MTFEEICKAGLEKGKEFTRFVLNYEKGEKKQNKYQPRKPLQMSSTLQK